MADTLSRPPRYRAFVSYSHRDSKVAKWLHGALETYRVPSALVGTEGEFGPVPRRLGFLFRDLEELAGAAELGDKLEDALKDSSALIVICSPAAAKSRWVDREIRFFKTVNPDRPVLAVIADGEPDGAEECFPDSLKYRLGPDGELDRSSENEPLAPDLQKLDHTTVKLKIIAGLLGVPYADLARRDIKRARRQWAMIVAGTFTIVVALATLSVAALTYARIAVHQKQRAEEATRVAERNAELAERKAWLAETAAEEVRRQADLLDKSKGRGPKP